MKWLIHEEELNVLCILPLINCLLPKAALWSRQETKLRLAYRFMRFRKTFAKSDY
jgi:hypothetical protein